MKNVLATIILFLCSTIIWAQESTVTGKVTSQDDGMGIPGVSVLVKGTTVGTITSLDGDFSLQANMGETLIFSFIGMETQEHVISSSTINVVMQSVISDLDEVVVIGYGVQKKSAVTGAISSIKAEDI